MTRPPRALRRLTLCIATLAIMLAALAPAWAQLSAAASGKTIPAAEICTASGMVTLAGGEQPPAGGDGKLSAKHCPWCKLGTCAGIAPSTATFYRCVLAHSALLALPDDPPLRGSPPHRPAAPRGPPAAHAANS